MPPAIDLARRYTKALAALRAIHDFDAWLGAHWRDRCPPPSTPPTAHTQLGADRAITWHEIGGKVIGYLPGSDGCFQIDRDLPLPDFPALTNVFPVNYGNDVLISAAMQEELQPPGR